MNEEIKKKWVGALRSGEYKQGRSILYNREDNTFCCLGVLCDLAVKEGIVTTIVGTTEDIVDCTFFGMEKAYEYLPEEVMEWANLSDNAPFVGIYTLTELNDDFKMSFENIADRIEKHL